MARGIALIVAAVLLGVVLLQATDDSEPFTRATSADERDDEVDIEPSEDDEVTDTTDTTAPPARNPAEVTVLVANGAGIDGLASRISDTLKAANYVTAEPGNTKAPADESAVFYTPGYEADARAIALLLNPQPVVEALPDPAPVDDMKSANVVVVAAADLNQATG